MKSIMEPKNNNIVAVTGKVVDITFRGGKNKNGQDYISYTAHVRVNQKMPGAADYESSDVELNGYATKFNKSGALSTSYAAIDKLHDIKTIENVGLDDADILSIDRGELQENDFVSSNTKQLVKTTRIRANNFFKVCRGGDEECAKMKGDMYILGITDEENSEGDLTGRVIVKGAIAGYQGKLNVFEFVAESEHTVELVRSNWEIGRTTPFFARLRAVKHEIAKPVTEDDTDYGESWGGNRTQTVRELVLTGVPMPYEEEDSYDETEMRKAYNVYKADLAQMLNDATSGAKKSANKTRDLGWAE